MDMPTPRVQVRIPARIAVLIFLVIKPGECFRIAHDSGRIEELRRCPVSDNKVRKWTHC